MLAALIAAEVIPQDDGPAPPSPPAGDFADFLAVFPEFSAVSEATWTFWHAQAVRLVGPDYGEDQDIATMLLTAHYLSLNGNGGGATGALAASGATSFRSGSFSATLSDSVVARRAKGGYGATPYGLQFQDIQRRLFGGPWLMGCD